MMAEVFGYSIFCDDVRHEASGQQTYVGVYNRILTAPLEVNLIPKMSVVTNVLIPNEIKWRQIKVRILLKSDDISEVIAEVPIPRLETDVLGETRSKHPNTYSSVGTIFNFVPFAIKDKTVLQVRAYLDDDIEVKCGVLEIRTIDLASQKLV